MNVCDFGGVLKALRTNRNLTQKELGAKLGLSKAVVSKYENGLSYPSFDLLLQIADYFHVTTDYLLGVSHGEALDITGLSPSQIDLVQQLIAEFRRSNQN